VCRMIPFRPGGYCGVGAADPDLWAFSGRRNRCSTSSGAEEQVTVLAARAAAHATLDHPAAIMRLLDALRAPDGKGQFDVLPGRAAAHAPVGDLPW